MKQQLASGQVIHFVYDAFGQLAAEYGGTGGAAGTQYLTTDHLGTTRVVSDGTQSRKCQDYLPFGAEISVSGGSLRAASPCYGQDFGVRQRFTGKERDGESGLDYFGARYYSGAQGRFTSPDPHNIITEASSEEEFANFLSNPQNWNRYAYVTNNPLSITDPDGRCPWCPLFQRLAPYADKAATAAQRYGQQASQSAQRYGQQAYVWATQFFSSPTGQEIAQTALEIATDSQVPQSTRLGAAREVAVAALAGGRLAGAAGEGLKITVRGLGSTDIDVIGKAGEFIAVGGPAKALKPAELGHHLKVLKTAAEQAGVKSQAYFEKGTPESVLKITRKRLGDDNVFEFER